MTKLIYGSSFYEAVKAEALASFGVVSTDKFDAKAAVTGRVAYLKSRLKETGMNGFVLGISGGVDSTTAGRLCQLACEELRAEGYEATFVAMRLPAGVQRDEEDAQAAVKFINADKMLTVNIGEAANNLQVQGVEEFIKAEGREVSPEKADFVKGNVKARLRMVAQYQVAALYNALVIGTDHSSEGITGFYTKWGDGACDLIVLNGMNKRQVRLVAKELGAPEALWKKAPTADLEELNPGKLDDEGFGFPYEVLDDFLEGKGVDPEIEFKIVRQYYVTQHKRQGIPGFVENRELS